MLVADPLAAAIHEESCEPHQITEAPVGMNTVLMVAYYFPPIGGAGTFRTLRFVKYLPEFGWRPTVVSVDPQSVRERTDQGLLSQVPESTLVARTGLYNPEQRLTSAWRRILGRAPGSRPSARDSHAGEAPKAESSGAASAFKKWLRHVRDFLFYTPDPRVWWVPHAVRAGWHAIRNENARLIYTTGPPHSAHLIGMLLKSMTGLPWIADFRDPWARQPWGGKIYNLWGQKLIPLFEARCVHQANLVILNTPRMADDFRRHYIAERPSKFTAIPNGYDPELQEQVADAVRESVRSVEPGCLHLCHAGALYSRRDLGPLLEAIQLLRSQSCPVVLEQIGYCAGRPELEKRIHELGLDQQVRLHDHVPHREVLRRLAAADLLLLVQPDNELQVPSKLYEMMLFDKPVLALAAGASADIVVRHRLGAVVNSRNTSEIAAAIRALAANRTSCRLNGESTRATAIDEYDGRRLTGRLADAFDEVDRHYST